MTSNRARPAETNADRTVFLVSEIGVGIRYFCQTGLLPRLLARGVRPVVVVPNADETRQLLSEELPAVRVEKLRLERFGLGVGRGASAWARSLIDVCATHLRITGMSNRMNLAVVRDYRELVERRWRLSRSRQRFLIPFLAVIAGLLRRYAWARRIFESLLSARPLDALHGELYDKYSPSLVVAASPGWWPAEETMLREAQARGVATLGVVPGWDHPCSKGLPGARPNRMVAWSDVHRKELVSGGDFDESAVDLAGPAHFDIYRDPTAASSRDSYMKTHQLNPDKRLITFGCTFVGMSPNLVIVRALAEAIARDEFGVPVQLLVRLHPSHFKPPVGRYREVRNEAGRFHDLAKEFPDLRIDAPLLGKEGIPNFTNPADSRSLASLFAHTDVFVTLFSTMVLESCFNDVPVVAAAFDPPASELVDFLPISHTLDWPTHSRIIQSGAAAVARDPRELIEAVRRYLMHPELHALERRRFAEQECTFLDGHCAERLAELIDSMIPQGETRSARHHHRQRKSAPKAVERR